MSTETNNLDPLEVAKFGELAHRWWDPQSEFRPLHEINPLRLDWIKEKVGIAGKAIVDIGCGGGILAESMARAGAIVKGIDLSDKALRVAQLHSLESGIKVDYERIAAEDLAARNPASFDLVTCMEMLEHVPDPRSSVSACATLAKPGANVFFSTINRNPKAYIQAVIGAEYLLRMLPKGTHDYSRFIKPSELSRWCRQSGLEIRQIVGMTYNPVTKVYRLGDDTDVNYLVHTVRV
jgi:2-polyprenyl-6-hydroxyphenyl methylase/3-demethylubiquinone-9 3-methyltransferase